MNADTWTARTSPTEETLYDAAMTAEGPVAVGDDGIVVGNLNGEWEVLIEAGPAVASNDLTTIDVTQDGHRVWFAGSSGALGCYDVDQRWKSDYSFPVEKTSTWEAIAVNSARGREVVRVANGSGEVFPFRVNGRKGPEWGEPVKPHSGSTIPSMDAGPDGTWYAVDTSGNVFSDDGSGWERIGIRNAQEDFYDIYVDDSGILVGAEEGIIYRYEPEAENWTPIKVGEEDLTDVSRSPDEVLAAGSSGAIYSRYRGGHWRRAETATDHNLWGVAAGDPDVAVGESGAIVERTTAVEPTRHEDYGDARWKEFDEKYLGLNDPSNLENWVDPENEPVVASAPDAAPPQERVAEDGEPDVSWAEATEWGEMPGDWEEPDEEPGDEWGDRREIFGPSDVASSKGSDGSSDATAEGTPRDEEGSGASGTTQGQGEAGPVSGSDDATAQTGARSTDAAEGGASGADESGRAESDGSASDGDSVGDEAGDVSAEGDEDDQWGSEEADADAWFDG